MGEGDVSKTRRGIVPAVISGAGRGRVGWKARVAAVDGGLRVWKAVRSGPTFLLPV